MRRGAHVELARFIEQRRHEIGALGAELEAIGAMGLDPSHPGARLVRRRHETLSPTRTRPLIHHITRRGDLVLRTPLLLVYRVCEAREGHAADCRYAVREPELVVVLGLGRLLRSPLVNVEVDD